MAEPGRNWEVRGQRGQQHGEKVKQVGEAHGAGEGSGGQEAKEEGRGEVGEAGEARGGYHRSELGMEVRLWLGPRLEP